MLTHCVQHFILISSFNTHGNPVRETFHPHFINKKTENRRFNSLYIQHLNPSESVRKECAINSTLWNVS